MEGESADSGIIYVKVGDSVTLKSGLTEMKNADLIKWSYGFDDILIAEIDHLAGKVNVYDGPDGRFRGRLNVDHQTGSLIITNITNDLSRNYKMQINSVEKSLLLITQNEISVKKGDSVTLHYGNMPLNAGDNIQWFLNLNDDLKPLIDSVTQYNNVANGRFRNRLTLDKKTGSLTISNIGTEDAGLYVLDTIYLYCTYNITVYDSVKL